MASSFVCVHVFQMYVSSGVACILSRSYVALAIHICCKCMFYLFHTYVASVLSICFICCNEYTRMLQVYVSNVLSVSNVCCKCFICILHMLQWLHTYVATVHFKCFTYFKRMLQQIHHIASVFISSRNMFHAFQMYFSYVLSECCLCFI
jgi:hypothetical protein